MAGHPKNIVFLTCDAFGVLPPVSRLTEDQAMYHFLSGYTAKVAGTEKGVTEPKVTFSTCFGAPFLPLHPGVYAGLLGEKMKKHDAKVWLLNTGWTGGPYGIGQRMKLSHTRRMVTAALAGELDNVETWTDPHLRPPASPSTSKACRMRSSAPARPGRTPPTTTPKPPSSPTCSPRTSRSTSRASTSR